MPKVIMLFCISLLVLQSTFVGLSASNSTANVTTTINTVATVTNLTTATVAAITPTAIINNVTTNQVINATLSPTTTEAVTTRQTTTRKLFKKGMKFSQRLHQNNQEVRTYVGETFVFNCNVEMNPALGPQPEPNVTWQLNDQPIGAVSYRMSKINLNKVFILEIENLLMADAGKYKCTVHNDWSTPITTSLTLVIVEISTEITQPEIEYFYPLNPVIQVGESITFSCAPKHGIKDVIPFIKWERYRKFNKTVVIPTVPTNGTNVTSTTTTTAAPSASTSAIFRKLKVKRMGSRSKIINGVVHETTSLKLNQCGESSFKINAVTLADSGEYSCIVFNRKGYKKQTTTLTVKPVPELTREEHEKQYIERFSKRMKLPYSLSVLVALPISILIVFIIGCIWWHENQKRLEEEEIKIVSSEKKEASPVKKPKLVVPTIFIRADDSISNSIHSDSKIVLVDSPTASKRSLYGSHEELRKISQQIDHEDDNDENTKLLDDVDDVLEVTVNDNENPSALNHVDGEWEHIDSEDAV